MQRTQISRSSSSDRLNNSTSSRVLIQSDQTLPLNIMPSSVVTTSTQSTTYTQTIQGIPSSFPSKSIPSFAETQVLSVYYPTKTSIPASNNDKCTLYEQQDREPMRYRLSYDPLALTKSTQTSLSSTPLSTHSSTLIIHANEKRNPNYKQCVKLHSGSQNLSNDIINQTASPNELLETSHYSYEEYILDVDDKQNRAVSTSSSDSSATTVIAQNSELNSSNREKSVVVNNQRVSSWPPVPDDVVPVDVQYENDEKIRLSQSQVSDRSARVIPILITNNLIEKPNVTSNNLPRISTNEKIPLTPNHSHPINQSKWLQNHIDKSDVQTNTTPGRVNTLRSIFEQPNASSSDSSTLASPMNQRRRIESEESSAKYGDEIRFRTKDLRTSMIHHAEPARIIPYETGLSVRNTNDDQSTSPFTLDQIREITGKQLKSLNDAGQYLQDGHTWQWNEIFWLSLTNSQRDQLKTLEYELHKNKHDARLSSSLDDTKPYKSTINVIGAAAWQQQNSSSGFTKYSELRTINETRPAISVLGASPSKMATQDSINQKPDLRIKTIEKSPSASVHQAQIDPLSYEQFIYDYLTTHGKHLRSNDNSLILSIDDQQIYLPSSCDPTNLTKHLPIDQDLLPFETVTDQLVIFVYGEPILLPVDRWSFYRNKYQNAQWIRKLKRINQNIPSQLISTIEEWLAAHTTLALDTHTINVDGLTIPLKGALGLQLHETQQLEINYWNELFNYLIRMGYVSYDTNEKIVSIANSELDVRRVLIARSLELVERVARYLRTLNNIHVENDDLFLTENFVVPHEYIHPLLMKYDQEQNFNANELAILLLEISHIEEDETNQNITLTFNNQTLEVIHYENHMDILIQWLNRLNQEKSIEITEQNDIFIHATNEQNQQQKIFIKHEHIDAFMKTKQNNNIVDIDDIANILFSYGYIQYSSGQLIFPMQNIVLNTNELRWLQSILHSIQPNEQTKQIDIELFDEHDAQILRIPFKYMSPTNDRQIVANYLFQNGLIEYDVTTGHYIYRYIPPDESSPTTDEYTNQNQLLSSQIREIHIDKTTQSIQLEFIHEPNHYLLLPSNWYKNIFEHQFNRSHIIDMLLTNGGSFDQEDNFIFNGRSYSLKPSNEHTLDVEIKQKQSLIDYYVEYINNKGEIKYDNVNRIIMLENLVDSSKLYLSREHTEFLQKNQFRADDMKYLLMKHSQVKQDEFQNWLLYYDNQSVRIPALIVENKNQAELYDHYHRIIDYMYNHNLIIYNKRLKFIQIHFSNQTLTIPLNQLQSIVDLKSDQILPFTSYQFSQWLLKNSDQINYLNSEHIQIMYKDKFYHLPLNVSEYQAFTHEEESIDSKLKLIFPFNTSLRLIQKTPSTTTLDIEPPSMENNYSIDPLLMLANYIHRAGTVYRDDLGRLIIKMNHNEIVVPRIEAMNAIESINTSPQRTGTIITRLIARIGKVESNKTGGLLITVGKSTFELSKEAIDRSNKIPIENDSKFKNPHLTTLRQQTKKSPILPLLQHSKSASSLSSSSVEEQSSFNDDQQIRYSKDGRGDARYLNLNQLNNFEQKDTRNPSSSDLKPCLLIIPDDKRALASNRTVRFYIQYINERDSTSNSNLSPLMMSSSEYSGRVTSAQLIFPQNYQNSALRQAPVYVCKQGDNKIYYENLAKYLSIEQAYLSPRIVRRMLKFTSANEFFAYLNKKMSASHAEQLVQQSEEQNDQLRSRSQENLNNMQNITTKFSTNNYEQRRSPQSTNGIGDQSLITSDKTVTLPRSATLSGQSNDGESESRVTVSRSASAVAKVVTSKSDTIKSTTSSSTPSSRENPTVLSSATVTRSKSLVSPNRTSGSKGAEEEVKKEKKSKFRTPSFLRKRKEKKEAANKDKSEK
ncbi:unnamed protein product [Rotaria magnacalcarata]|uniref:Uncharacterized protein n=1 Tax=Rotaria magnacalcarata TaxID=392030 RepID=A0A816TN77_9BILA|nr:unnamed protein product [Rotaria magnacalcarata]